MKLLALLTFSLSLSAQLPVERPRPEPAAYQPPALDTLWTQGAPNLSLLLTQYQADSATLNAYYSNPLEAQRALRLREFYTAWSRTLASLPYAKLSPEAQIDYHLLKNLLGKSLDQVALDQARFEEVRPLVPFASRINSLILARQRVDRIDPEKAAAELVLIDKQLAEVFTWIDKGNKTNRSLGLRAAETTAELRTRLEAWFKFYSGYDPLFNWWVEEPYSRLDKSLARYASTVREKVAGLKPTDKDTILGDPVGRDALIAQLKSDFIAYTPEELIAFAQEDLKWCEDQMRQASRDMGLGDDWKQALERVKGKHVAPGEQPVLIRNLVLEAIDFLRKNNLVTVPQTAADYWLMQMMSPERQRVNPFFLGGPSIIVAFPTNTMSHEQKEMALRGNNLHFARATVHHEVIPGHNLQFYYRSRFRPWRRAFDTPFWTEGWALYWEMLLWDKKFYQSPEDRVGMLFWRMHRAARIVFSLSFHTGKMTAAECVDYLVDRVGHERENAAAEVRRSFESTYPPLYQAAYLVGGLQIRSLHNELVRSGKMQEREFHDRILQQNNMPVEFLRAVLKQDQLPESVTPQWRFLETIKNLR